MKITLDKKHDIACAIIYGEHYPLFPYQLVRVIEEGVDIPSIFSSSRFHNDAPEVTFEQLKQFVAEDK